MLETRKKIVQQQNHPEETPSFCHLQTPEYIEAPQDFPLILNLVIDNPTHTWRYYRLECTPISSVEIQGSTARIAVPPQKTTYHPITLVYLTPVYQTQSGKKTSRKKTLLWPPTSFSCTLKPLVPLTSEAVGEAIMLSVELFARTQNKIIYSPNSLALTLTLTAFIGFVIVGARQWVGWTPQKVQANTLPLSSPLVPATPAPTITPAPTVPVVLMPFQAALAQRKYDTIVYIADEMSGKDPNNTIARDLKGYAAVRKDAPSNLDYVRQLLDKTGGMLSDTSTPDARAVHLCAEWAYFDAIGNISQRDDAQRRAIELNGAVARALIMPSLNNSAF